MTGGLAARRGAGDPVESGKQGKVAHDLKKRVAPRCSETHVPRDFKVSQVVYASRSKVRTLGDLGWYVSTGRWALLLGVEVFRSVRRRLNVVSPVWPKRLWCSRPFESLRTRASHFFLTRGAAFGSLALAINSTVNGGANGSGTVAAQG